ncbi:exported hypothetical protein [Candidatus Terasakiella magnetica]|uniref:Uncharacterized protein n=1 Tax=Candidatus Terasakiella magnetica TaxID=1867952 RepID=A0A1C3RIB8_9PROT|nr:hypothetical protein [Candidatus Terasakiella magnetica]SCA57027.1 exported hypothetical protein [Candidatus Terasakiella magnetica]
MIIKYLLPCLFALLALVIWYLDGAWQNGAMPTKGMIKVVGFAGLAGLCFFMAKKFKKAS